MSKENLNYMPNENANKLEGGSLSKAQKLEEIVNSPNFDPEEHIERIAKFNCNPLAVKRLTNLSKMIQQVELVDINESEITDPATKLLIASSRFTSAVDAIRDNLTLKEIEFVKGVEEFFAGATAFSSTLDKKARIALVASVVATVPGLAGCTSLVNADTPGTDTPPITETIQAEIPEETKEVNPIFTFTPTFYPTETPTSTPTEIATPVRPEGGSGGPYGEEQMKLIDAGNFSSQEEALSRWVYYWAKSSEPPFNPESSNLQYKYVFDENNPGDAGVLLENLETGKTFYLPIRGEEYMEYPPEVNASDVGRFDIAPGFGPLDLSGGSYMLAWRKNAGWVRVDTEGNIRETLDLETAQWEVTENYKDFEISNRVDASVSIGSVRQRLVNQENSLIDISKEDYTSVYAASYILAYDFDRKNGDMSFYVLVATYGGVFRVKVDYINIPNDVNFSSLKKVSELTNEEARQIAKDIDSEINLTNERPDFNDNGVTNIIFKSPRSQKGVNNCITATTFSSDYNTAKDVCVFDPEGYLEPQDVTSLINENIVPINSTSEYKTIISTPAYKIQMQVNTQDNY